MKHYHAAIIGGGAAGLCAAAALKQRDPGCEVVLIEQLSRVGKKLITTGNGRCNITNAEIIPERYHGENPGFCLPALTNYDRVITEQIFAEMGIVFTFDETGRAYPYSLQASSVVDALRFAVEGSGTELRSETKVTAIRRQKDGYLIETDGEPLFASAVLMAAGGYAGGKKLGSDGSGLALMQKLGYPVVKTTPAIVQVKTATETVRQLKGIKVNAEATLWRGDKPLRSESGEVLFCDYGLSGPPILQISRAVERVAGDKKITLNLMPDYSPERLWELLRYRASTLYRRPLEEFFTGMLNKRVGQVIVKLAGRSLGEPAAVLNNNDLKKLSSLIRYLPFAVTGTTGYDNAQVTAGGLDTDAFDPLTMMSRRDPGLFAAGEILDVDGDCGGFNLQWAWSSAMTAADGICAYLGAML